LPRPRERSRPQRATDRWIWGQKAVGPPSLPPGPPLSFTMKTALNDVRQGIFAVHAVELRPRRAPHEVALIIRDAVRTPCKAAVPGIDAQQLVVRAVPRQQQRQRHIRSVAHVPGSDHVQICTKWPEAACCSVAATAGGPAIDGDRSSMYRVDDHHIGGPCSTSGSGPQELTHIELPVAEPARAVRHSDAGSVS
jgi:hypothetical protein